MVAIYLVIDSEEGQRSTTMSISGAAHHPAILDPTDSAEFDQFVHLLDNEIPHWDFRGNGFESHGRKDRLTNTLNRSDYYNGDPAALFESVQVDHIGNLYYLSNFLPGKTLEETNSAFAMGVCNDLIGSSLCNDLSIHTRPFIQHANFDQYSQSGFGTSGNPWDSSTWIDPPGWLDNHELGHNLQVNRLNIGYTSSSEDWSTYQSRATENSNNMFPYYVRWRHHYHSLGNTTTIIDEHSSGKLAFANIMYDVVGLTNSAGERVIVDNACQVVSTGGLERHDELLQGAGYVDHNWYRMQFYIQLMLRTQGMTFRNGTENKWGYDLVPLLYLLQRSFGHVAQSESDWDANKANFGFELFPYSGHAVYGGGNVGSIPGNDWLLVTLSYLTQYNWLSQFELFGLRTTSLAQSQAQAHGTLGDLPMGLYVLDTDLPPANWTDGVTWLPMALDDSSTVWPRDGFTPLNCTDLTYTVEPVYGSVTAIDSTTYQLNFTTPSNVDLTVENLTPELISLDENNRATIVGDGRAAVLVTGDNISQTYYFDAASLLQISICFCY